MIMHASVGKDIERIAVPASRTYSEIGGNRNRSLLRARPDVDLRKSHGLQQSLEAKMNSLSGIPCYKNLRVDCGASHITIIPVKLPVPAVNPARTSRYFVNRFVISAKSFPPRGFSEYCPFTIRAYNHIINGTNIAVGIADEDEERTPDFQNLSYLACQSSPL